MLASMKMGERKMTASVKTLHYRHYLQSIQEDLSPYWLEKELEELAKRGTTDGCEAFHSEMGTTACREACCEAFHSTDWPQANGPGPQPTQAQIKALQDQINYLIAAQKKPNQGGKGHSKGNGKTKSKCFYCTKEGHFRRDCQDWKSAHKKGSPTPQSNQLTIWAAGDGGSRNQKLCSLMPLDAKWRRT